MEGDLRNVGRTMVQAGAVLATAATILLAPNAAQATGTYGYSSPLERSSGSVTTTDVVRSVSSSIAAQITGHIAAAIRPPSGPTGLSSGESSSGLAVWGSASGTRLDNSAASTRFRADLGTLMAGADIPIGDTLVLGAAVAGEAVHGDTAFNDGAFGRSGVSFVPYAAFRPTDDLSVTAMLGYGGGWAQSGRKFAGVSATADYEYQRLMASAEASYRFAIGALSLTPKVGYLYAMERNTTYSEMRNDGQGGGNTIAARWDPVGEARIGLRASYDFGRIEPYAQATYVFDNVMRRQSMPAGSPQVSNDQDEVQFQAGLAVQVTSSLEGSIDLTQSVGRDDMSETSFGLNLRLHL
jgi:outer membrane autotransporter protein